MPKRTLLPVLISAIALIVGCRGNGREATYPAGGTVKFKDGRPLAGGSILCDSPNGLAARAIINADGTFQLGTYEEADGAVAGKHRASLRPPATMDTIVDGPNRGKRPPGLRLDKRFLDFEKSGIEFEVKADGENNFVIEVSEPKK